MGTRSMAYMASAHTITAKIAHICTLCSKNSIRHSYPRVPQTLAPLASTKRYRDAMPTRPPESPEGSGARLPRRATYRKMRSGSIIGNL